MRCLALELSRVYWSHGGDQTMLTIWLSQLIHNMRPGMDLAHNSTTLPLFERYLAALFGCSVDKVWEVADEWTNSLHLHPDEGDVYPPLREVALPDAYLQQA